ncbi:MAG: cytochrome c3 family protein [Usitatibacteraceae bacterium]
MNAINKVQRKFVSLTLVALASAASLMFAQSALAQISTTKHNLGTTGPGPNKFGGTDELCVFCHTPHGADTSAAAPLWNRVISGTTYQTYDSLGTSTLDGKTAPVGSVSIACMSCHDGTQAMNVVINAPGSGGYNATGAPMPGAWSGANQTGGAISPGLITNLTTDLRNDHPIGIRYCGGGQTSATPTGACVDADFRAPSTTAAGGLAGSRQKTDMALYTRGPGAGGGGYVGQTEPEPFVECASCHDPHSANPTFLRIANTGSAVCLACHVK